jgi:hypothetical protein
VIIEKNLIQIVPASNVIVNQLDGAEGQNGIVRFTHTADKLAIFRPRSHRG